MVDVLDVNGALFDTGTTGGAAPQGVDVDDRTLVASVSLRVVTVGLAVFVEVALADQRPLHLGGDLVTHLCEDLFVALTHLVGLPGAGGGQQVRRGREHVVAQVHDHELGAQGLAGVPRRTLALAPPALRAGGHVEHALPREVLDAAATEGGVVRRVLEVDLLGAGVHGQQRTEGVRLPLGADVDRSQEDVQVLAVEHQHEEPEHDREVQQQEERLDPFVGGQAQRVQETGEPLGGERAA